MHTTIAITPSDLAGILSAVLDVDAIAFSGTPEEKDALAPPPDISVSEYADANRILQAGVSRNPGPWSTDYTPYLRMVMDLYKLPSLRHLVVCFGTQLGKTEALYNILLYIIGHDPYSTMLMYPREEDARGVSRTRVQPMIDDCAVLRSKKPARADLYQALEMHFPGMILYLNGANSLAALAQKPCRNVLRDEIDKYPVRLGKDADPLSKSEERTKSYWDIRKIIDVSSPTFEDVGILKQLGRCNIVFRLNNPCPHCGEMQELKFENIKWDDQPDSKDREIIAKQTAHYICDACGDEITNYHRPWMIANCEYRQDREIDYEPEMIGLWASSLSSPNLTWGDIAAQFIKANRALKEEGDNTKMQNFYNDWLALAWSESVKKSSADVILARRCDLDPLVVPEQAVALTCGIDVQKHGFWFSVWAWTSSFESWLIHYGYLAEWEDVYSLVFDTSFPIHNSRSRMMIWRAAMDTGGGEDSKWGDDWTKTEEIVTWIRENGQGVVFGVKGMSRTGGQKIKLSVQDKMPGNKGAKIPGGVSLWMLDTQQLKDTFFWRISNGPEDPQPLHLHAQTGNDFAAHLLAEEKQRNKNGRWAWVQVSRDNHLLDTCVYAHAAADFQWMGGVKILSGPVGVVTMETKEETNGTWSYEGEKTRRPARPVHGHRERSMVKPAKFTRPSWLRQRR